MNETKLRELALLFDGSTGNADNHMETLQNINIELSNIAEDVRGSKQGDSTDNVMDMAMMFLDIKHKVLLLSDLLNYTVADMEGNLTETRSIKDNFFDIIVRDSEDLK